MCTTLELSYLAILVVVTYSKALSKSGQVYDEKLEFSYSATETPSTWQ